MSKKYQNSHTEAAKNSIELYERTGEKFWLEKAEEALNREA